MSAGIDAIDNVERILLQLTSLNVSDHNLPKLEVNFSLPQHINERIEDLEIVRDQHMGAKEKKKAKNRRRAKNKNKLKVVRLENELDEKVSDEADLFDHMVNSLSIQAMRPQKNAIVLRKRNAKCQYIHIGLYSFLNSREPYIFTSTRWFNSANVQPRQTNPDTSTYNGIFAQNHKYPVTTDNLQSSTSQAKNKRQQRKHVYSNNSSEKSPKFEDFLLPEDVEEGLFLGRLVKGVLRINPKNCQNAYVSNVDRNSQDYMINSVVDRNRAFEGDVVVLKLKAESRSQEEHKPAQVVHILEKVHPRTAIGTLSELYHRGHKVITLLPRDKRLPRIIITKTSIPPFYQNNLKENAETLFMAKITDWPTPKFASGVIIETVGQRADLKAETMALLLENQLTVEPFPPSIEKFLPKSSEIPSSELQNREDLREACIFTIDPLTARDLDDAVSCRTLPNGNLEVGVHIADVSHFLEENTELDAIVSKKATTIYLVDQAHHMLPVELCLHCSLLPGKDALAFSVFWEMTEDGEVLSHRFSRTVINSCCQLAYEHAQKMIDDPENFDASDLPDIYNNYKAADLCEVITKLKQIARNLRQKRTENGALRIDQVKLIFKLDQTGSPLEFLVYENRESHRLIEEFMLLANITTAQQILNYAPNLALLRCHDEPNPRLISELQKMLEVVGIHIDVSTSGSLNSSLQNYNTNDYLGKTRNTVLNHLLAKPMIRARYFCASHSSFYYSSVDSFNHYALSVPLYTHFTSPIRRYADIMVHRILAASLGYREKPSWSVDEVQNIADNCNRQKYNAKRAGECSSDLFLAHYIETHQPFVQDAVVVNVKERSFDVLILNTGSIVRMFTSNFGDAKHQVEEIDKEKKMWRIIIYYPELDDQPAMTQVIELFQIIKVNLKRKEKTNSLKGEIIRPDPICNFN